jgi:macrolide-specific efflux system membrane fusion protein
MKKHKTKIILGMIAILIVGFVVWKFILPKNEATQYQTAKAEKGTLVSTVSASGNVISANMVNVSTSATGVISQVFVTNGEEVTAGQKIAEIELDADGAQKQTQAWNSYLSAKNTIDAAETTKITLQSDMLTKWDTFKKMAESGLYQNSDGSPRTDQRYIAEFNIANDDWLAAEKKYKDQNKVLTQAQLALQSAWLSYAATSSEVTAPVDGIVDNVTIVPGMMLASTSSSSSSSTTTSTTRVAIVRTGNKLLSSFNLSEIDVSKVKVGQKATIMLDSVSGKTFTGKVLSVDRVGTVSSNVTNYPVIVEFDLNDAQILPNMAATANIITEVKRNVLLVPNAAVQTSQGQQTVRVLENGNPRVVSVEVGSSSDTQTEITSGLKEGDEVVTGTVATTTGQTGSVFGGSGRGGGAFFGR